ncbi:unnamed protein product [Prunus armeniaca]
MSTKMASKSSSWLSSSGLCCWKLTVSSSVIESALRSTACSSISSSASYSNDCAGGSSILSSALHPNDCALSSFCSCCGVFVWVALWSTFSWKLKFCFWLDIDLPKAPFDSRWFVIFSSRNWTDQLFIASTVSIIVKKVQAIVAPELQKRFVMKSSRINNLTTSIAFFFLSSAIAVFRHLSISVFVIFFDFLKYFFSKAKFVLVEVVVLGNLFSLFGNPKMSHTSLLVISCSLPSLNLNFLVVGL